jgi:hypothetical protein
LRAKLQPARSKVIEVDFKRRRGRMHLARAHEEPPAPIRFENACQALAGAREYLLFWHPPGRRGAAEYLGGRWDWGWTLFVWTSEAAVGDAWETLVGGRDYIPQRLTREAFASFLRETGEIGGLLIDGELEGPGKVIRAESDQLIQREAALSELAPRR